MSCPDEPPAIWEFFYGRENSGGKSLRDRVAGDESGAGADFTRRLFWRCLPRRAWLAVPLLGGIGSRHFAADRALIEAVGRATHMGQVRDEVRKFLADPSGRNWLRRRLRLRVSGRRVLDLASRHLPGATGWPETPRSRAFTRP